jgi:hypothetical protein
VQSLQAFTRGVFVPALGRAFDAGGGENPDIVHQALERALVLGESIAFCVEAHGVKVSSSPFMGR